MVTTQLVANANHIAAKRNSGGGDSSTLSWAPRADPANSRMGGAGSCGRQDLPGLGRYTHASTADHVRGHVSGSMRTQGRGAGVVAVIDANYRSRWFRRYPGRPSRVRLVCLPHAGGTATLFHGWAERLPHDVETLAVQYPGRQERFAEPCIEDMAELATRITEALEPELAGPLDLFWAQPRSGRRLRGGPTHRGTAWERAAPCPGVGRGAPHTERGGALHLLDDERLIASARRLGDLGSSAYDNPDLRPLLLPSLRGDYRLIERYRPGHPAPRPAPVTALGGDRTRDARSPHWSPGPSSPRPSSSVRSSREATSTWSSGERARGVRVPVPVSLPRPAARRTPVAW
ncbi:hypothetical protein SANTM175S_03946 [Streptomyces antimycoticus]